MTFETYINGMNGQWFASTEVMDRYIPTVQDLTKFKKMVSDFDARDALNVMESYSDFKARCPDIAKACGNEELFYATKNGYALEEVPAKLVFMCRKAYTTTHCVNAVPHILPKGMLEDAFTVGYLRNGWTMCDILRKFCDSKFVLLSRVGSYCLTSLGAEFLLSEDFKFAFLPKDYVTRHDLSKFMVLDTKLYDEYGHEVDLND